MGKRILIIGEDTEHLISVSDLLTEEGFNVHTSIFEDDIFADVETIRPHLVLLDANEKVDYVKLCSEIKQSSGVDVILMSSYIRLPKKVLSESCALGIVPNPFNIEDLFEIVDFALKQDFTKTRLRKE
jgi:DNA-binding response OmpR family regulator